MQFTLPIVENSTFFHPPVKENLNVQFLKRHVLDPEPWESKGKTKTSKIQ